MYGDSAIMRKRSTQLREQGGDIATMADRLVSQSDAVAWTGRAADAMRDRVRERAALLRECAADHETAAESLDRHRTEVERHKDAIAETERRAQRLLADHGDDPALRDFTPPPSGHRDWLTADLPGAR